MEKYSYIEMKYDNSSNEGYIQKTTVTCIHIYHKSEYFCSMLYVNCIFNRCSVPSHDNG